MKVILSRKGFDSGYGGAPSPVLPDGTMLSLPIPVTGKTIQYKELEHKGVQYSEIIRELIGDQIKVEGEGKFPIDEIYCHLDPDIREFSYKRKQGWKGIFGQSGGAYSHLSKQGVCEGDLFLFFGWFRKTIHQNGVLKFDPKCKGFHAIYGYLQVGKIEKINCTAFEQWALYHPHVSRGTHASSMDHLYSSSDALSFEPIRKGYGIFDYSPNLVLTKDGCSRSRWELPEFFKRYKISYHTENSWKKSYFQSAAKGQEFVVHADDQIMNWVKTLYEEGTQT